MNLTVAIFVIEPRDIYQIIKFSKNGFTAIKFIKSWIVYHSIDDNPAIY